MGSRQDKLAFLRRVFGGVSLASDGVNISVRCPNSKCGSQKKGKRKLSIHIDKDQSHCWVCGLKSHNTLVPILRRICTPTEVAEYVNKFAPKSARFLGDEGGYEPEEQQVHVPEDYLIIAQHLGSRDPRIKRAVNYLKRRGIGESELWRFKIGMSSEPRFDNRVIVPSFDEDGYLNTYAARTFDKRGWPNYLIPKVDRIGIVFNELNVDWGKEITLVEGPLDLVKCVGNATCLQGSSLTEDHLLFWKLVSNRTPVVMALDADATRKSVKIAKLLASYDVPVRIMNLGSFADVGEMDRKSFLAAHKAARPWTSMEGLRMTINAWSPSSGST